ncbi:MAG: glutamate formimidoyltransferase [Bacteroidetes bacterium]|nr:MAG: glutamate formimidoyltransferase [Bacteroidota bacterium]REJ99933.1 MAG: glutamate formimidoyltransferase [Bacteroidota bacterium]REK35887.1 MAG: glutamate formimidoyltransferase [Bacteroidota bacterium]REK50636.1 MAG: glutamate formimidoyltransferase [Bacteroidota bacterium]
MKKIIECVPNFSEGRDMNIIRQITEQIESVEGVKLLNVDPGKATNRTVVTLVGEPEQVIDAAFRAIRKAGELIDMSKHKGEHPRMGATDVCPLIPISGISMEETVKYAQKLAERVGNELKIPVYLYEEAQKNSARKNLSVIRAGEYEGYFSKIKLPEWKPDYGPVEFPAGPGATVIGARDFLVAYNVNLNTTSVRRANSVAFDVRENGRKVKNEKGEEIVQPGTCKAVKAIGWFIEEYGIAQVSMNLTNISITPVHIAFDECVKSAFNRGMRVTGSELVGLIPLKALTDAGKYFLGKQNRSAGVSERELVRIAVKSMGLDELSPFNPDERIIEYRMKESETSSLISKNLKEFADETASESPAPGGGSISAYAGALGASLGTMVANLSSHKKGWDDHWEEFSKWAEKGQKLKDELLLLVDEDTNAFNGIMNAFGMPKGSEEEKKLRSEAIQTATRNAIEVPFRIMQLSFESMALLKAMTETGNPNSVTDAGVGALCANAAVRGAFLNVRINSTGLTDKAFVAKVAAEGEKILESARKSEKEILDIVNLKMNGS